MISPYNPSDPYELNLSLIPDYARDLVSQGVKGIFLCGTNGESVSLSNEERKQLLEAWLKTPEFQSKSLRIIAHVGHHCLRWVSQTRKSRISVYFPEFPPSKPLYSRKPPRFSPPKRHTCCLFLDLRVFLDGMRHFQV